LSDIRRIVELYFIGESKIIRCCEGDHPAHVHGGIGAEEKAVGVHQKKIGVTKPALPVGLNGAKDSRRISSGHTTQDVGGGQVRSKYVAVEINRPRIKEIGNIVGRNAEVSKAVEQIGSTCTSRASSARDVVYAAVRRHDCAQSGGRDC
jgi:hypothetical protein